MQLENTSLWMVLYRGLAVVLMLSAPLSWAFGAEGARLVSSGSERITFEIDVPAPEIIPAGEDGTVRVRLAGYGSFSPPGAVELPGRTFSVAIPPEGDARITFAILSEEPLGRLPLARVPAERFVRGERDIPVTEFYYPPDPWETSGPPAAVAAGRPCFMGRQRVLPVQVNPLIHETGGSRLIRAIRVTVHLDRNLPARTEIQRDVPISGVWRRLYGRALVNPGDVARFRKPLAPVRMLRGPLDDMEHFRIQVPETGLFVLRADSLGAAGLSPTYMTDMIALRKYYYDEGEPDFLRSVDIPVLIVEGGSAAQGIFEGDDLLIFYAMGIKDDPDAGDIDARYTDDNTYWLEAGGQGTPMEEMLPLPGTSGLPPGPFPARTLVRKDTFYKKKEVLPGSTDFNFHALMVGDRLELPFVVHHPDAGSTFDLTVRGTGAFDNGKFQRLTFRINGQYIGTDSLYSNASRTFVFADLSPGLLADGSNELVIESTVDYALMVNDFTIDYRGLFVAHDDLLEFAIVPSVFEQTVEIPGFTAASGVLIEITDPANPRYRILPPEYFSGVSSPYTCTFNLEPPVSGERRFIIAAGGAGGRIPGSGIEEDYPSDLLGEAGPFHSLIISHGDFIDELAGYTAWRRDQGYRILTVDVQDVYDEFNGGMPNSDAIRRFIKYGVDHWGVEFALLVGDGNEDQKAMFEKTPPNYIPPFTFSFNVIGVGFDDEVMATDRYYSFLDEPPPIPLAAGSEQGAEGATDNQYYLRAFMLPDVMLGRIPIGDIYEFRALFIKMQSFEEPEVDDTWRRRVILFADDAWSGRLNYYQYKYGEDEFENSMRIVAESVEDALPGGFDIMRLNLSVWTEEPHKNPNGDLGSVVYSRTQDSVRTYFTPYLIKKWNEGAQILSFQGHGNRSTLTTEAAFAALKLFDDLDSLKTPIPNIFTAYGCHISEFGKASELGLVQDGDNGDCITEQFLFKPRSGSVGTYASTGYEFLSDNARLCENFHDVLFHRPPTDSVPPNNEYTGARWILGELLLATEIEHIQRRSYGFAQVFRYIILGDPMLRIDTGPPLMKLEGDYGDGYVEISPDSLHARNGTNDVKLRFTASDVVALEKITLHAGDADWTDSLDTRPLLDTLETYARGYRADLDYTIGLEDGGLSYRVFKPGDRLVGIMDVSLSTRIRFFNEELEILPGSDSPPTGTFRLTVDFPAYLAVEPELLIDGARFDAARFNIPDPHDSLHWETVFAHTFPSGHRVLTVRVGAFMEDFEFTVGGNELVLEAFNFPNPFTGGTNIVYTLNLPVDGGSIEIFNVSGILIRSIRLPGDRLGAANFLDPHSVYWDGRDFAGDHVANGTYLYVLRVQRGGGERSMTGKCVKLE